jgi:glycosyltransferase involved in cell wall biosynthesis
MAEKVVFIADRIVNPFSGTEKQLVDLILSLDRTRWEPLLCTLVPTPWSETFAGCLTFSPRIRTLKTWDGWRGYARLVRWLRKQRPAVVHAYLRDASYLGVTAAKLAGVGAIAASRRGDHRWEGWGPRFFIRQVNRIPRRFVANSSLVARATVEKEGADASRVLVIPNAIEPERFRTAEKEDRAACREALGIPAGSFAVAAVANIRPIKRLDVLVDALPAILKAEPNAVVHLVGDGIGTADIRRLVADRGLMNAVVFWGSRTDVPRILRAMDAAVLCSDFESQPSAVLEYMASALPVACTDVGNCAELIESGKTGYVFQPGDVRALAEAVIMTARGQYDPEAIAVRRETLFAKQNPERITERYMALYDELLRPRSA